MTPWVGQLIFANVVMFVATLAFPRLFPMLWLVPAELLVRPWTAITYMFLHGGMLHLLFNMIALFFFGPRLEGRLGARRFLWLYFVSGITGALLSSMFTPNARIVGASGAVFGVLLAFAYYYPRDRILVWGILPVEARWFVVILTLLSLYAGFGGTGGGVAHFAHLGGFLGGFLYLKWMERTSEARKFKKKAEPSGARLGDRRVLEQWRKIQPEGLHEVNRTEYERIRQKIELAGASSLSSRERAFIERFSRAAAG